MCDISGSMNRYSRVFLHFLHAITNDRDRVHTFVFGTRLTNVTRCLRHRDVDIAMTGGAELVADWSGGTRIGASIRDFNLHWSRRVLGQGASVLLFTDGLERDGAADLEREMERLKKSCRRLVWLNPLLRYDRFEAKAQGVQAIVVAHTIDLTEYATDFGGLALAAKIPLIAPWRDSTVGGGLLSLGANTAEMYRLGARQVGRILKGDKAEAIPVAVAEPELTVNTRTARYLGITVPATVTARAHEVI